MIRWLLWWTVLALWTVALVMPDPLGGDGSLSETEPTLKWLIAKSGHLTVYTALAAVVVLLPGRPFWPLAVLVGHALLGEWLQTLTPSRTGCWTDVAIDLLGIVIGGILVWRTPTRSASDGTINGRFPALDG